mmetsp:Transcript_15594/g.29987  ORF Transcript_15594/g.29987 Transcript_15594/m.29987 type:complete len:103 (+) Transcript_15594:120-428(+)
MSWVLQPRISTPFFLRPRSDALLDPAALKSSVLQSVGCTEENQQKVMQQMLLKQDNDGAPLLDVHIMMPCLMWQLDNNTNECRDKWPWKTETSHYESMQYSS